MTTIATHHLVSEIRGACVLVHVQTNSLLEKKTEPPISEKDIDSLLYTVGLPNPDLLIRTSGEMRISNFLLWQIAYTEIFVTEVLWPDFRERDLLEAILEFQKRERRYGDIQEVTRENIR